MISLYNTLTHKKETFAPIRPTRVSLYSCGPTVYNQVHIGNLRAFVTADILVRTLQYNKYEVVWAMNTTDVDDKTIKGAVAFPNYAKDPEGALRKFTRKYEELFWQDLEKLNIAKPDHITRATEHIPAMQELINKIREAGFAYEKNGSVYFDVKKYTFEKKYGRLVDIDMAHLRAGTRVDEDEYEKESAQDFALWKKAGVGEPAWVLLFGEQKLSGRPGWHIECSAMAHDVLDYPFDIHTGGVDLRFPHHENEIAQSVAGYGEIPARFWVHNEHLLVDGKKMAKSAGTFITLAEIMERGFSPLAYRYFLLTAQYRTPVNFTWEALAGAQAALSRLIAAISELPDGGAACAPCDEKFRAALADDLNTAEALATVWRLISRPDVSPADKKATLLSWDVVLGFGLASIRPVEIPPRVHELAEEREGARKANDFARADQIRAEIESLGFEIRDTETGFKITKK